MASAEERERILAEYREGADGPSEDEMDYEEEDSSDDEAAAPPKSILKGSVSKAEGSDTIVYGGQWSYSLEDAESWKFKYKMSSPSSFDFSSPPQSATFDGYFIVHDPENEGGLMKISEKGIVMTFESIKGKEGKRWGVVAKGANQFGSFDLMGEYRYKKGENKMNFEKTYQPPAGAGSGSDSEEFEEDDRADEEELAGLEADANLPLDELRKRLAADQDQGGSDQKKVKVDDEEAEKKEEEETK